MASEVAIICMPSDRLLHSLAIPAGHRRSDHIRRRMMVTQHCIKGRVLYELHYCRYLLLRDLNSRVAAAAVVKE